MKDKILKEIFSTMSGLYLFLLIIPYIIICLIDKPITLNNKLVAIIALIYALISALITYINYKKINKLANEDKLKRCITLKHGLLALLTYFFTTILEGTVIFLLVPNYNSLPLIIKTIYLSIYEIIQVLLIIYILKDEVKKSLEDIKVHHKEYFSQCTKYYLLALILMAISNLIISLFNSGDIAGNEQNVRELFTKAPVYMYFSAVIMAPILEELTFRQGIRNIFTNDKLFIIVSGLVFGGLHVIGNVNTLIDLFYIIPYSIPGFAFAYMLTKTKNIFTSMGFHFFHNGVSMTIQLILLLLGL